MKFFPLFALLVAAPFAASSEDAEPTYFDIEFLSALIGPMKVNGRPWDSRANVNSAAVALISEMVLPGSGAAASSVVSAVNRGAPQGVAAPDVIGYVLQKGPTTRHLARFAGIPMALVLRNQKAQDSYTPRFYTSYQAWPVFLGTRFQIQLWDADIMNDDPIAVVEINRVQLESAVEKGEPTWINVSDQSMNQLLYILVSVSKSSKGIAPKMNGNSWR